MEHQDKRFVGSEGRKYEIIDMWQKQHEIKRYVLLGYGNKKIAVIMNCTPQNISDIRNSEVFKQEVEILRVARDSSTVDVARAIIEDSHKSLTLLQETRDNVDHPLALRVKIAEGLLDRDPKSAKVKSIQGELTIGYVSHEDIERIKKEANEAKLLALSDNIVDAEIEEVTSDIDLDTIDNNIQKSKENKEVKV